MARVTVVDGNGKVRKIAEALANDKAFMASHGLTKQEVKKPVKKATPKKTTKKK